MSGAEVAYLAMGVALVAALAGVAAHYFSRRRRDEVEKAKFKMLDDDLE